MNNGNFPPQGEPMMSTNFGQNGMMMNGDPNGGFGMQQAAMEPAPKKKGFFGRLFGGKKKKDEPAPMNGMNGGNDMYGGMGMPMDNGMSVNMGAMNNGMNNDMNGGGMGMGMTSMAMPGGPQPPSKTPNANFAPPNPGLEVESDDSSESSSDSDDSDDESNKMKKNDMNNNTMSSFNSDPEMSMGNMANNISMNNQQPPGLPSRGMPSMKFQGAPDLTSRPLPGTPEEDSDSEDEPMMKDMNAGIDTIGMGMPMLPTGNNTLKTTGSSTKFSGDEGTMKNMDVPATPEDESAILAPTKDAAKKKKKHKHRSKNKSREPGAGGKKKHKKKHGSKNKKGKGRKSKNIDGGDELAKMKSLIPVSADTPMIVAAGSTKFKGESVKMPNKAGGKSGHKHKHGKKKGGGSKSMNNIDKLDKLEQVITGMKESLATAEGDQKAEMEETLKKLEAKRASLQLKASNDILNF